MVTYTASALLHVRTLWNLFNPTSCCVSVESEELHSFVLQGSSFHLGAVLISLGFITYVEHGETPPNVLLSHLEKVLSSAVTLNYSC